MPLADLLRPEQRQWLRRLRRRIANREVMRRHRAANRDKRLCAGVDLPLDAGDLRAPRLARARALLRLPRAAPVAAQPRAQPRRDRRGRTARARRGRRRNARRRPVRGHRPGRPPARRPVHARRSLPALVAPNTRPALPAVNATDFVRTHRVSHSVTGVPPALRHRTRTLLRHAGDGEPRQAPDCPFRWRGTAFG